jgi:hypothetical protein
MSKAAGMLSDERYAYRIQLSLLSVVARRPSLSQYLEAMSTVERHFDALVTVLDDVGRPKSRRCHRPMGQRTPVSGRRKERPRGRIGLTACYAIVALSLAHL